LIEHQRPILAEDAFMAGLLHDIGRVALVSQIGVDYMPQFIEPALDTDTPLHVREQEVLGFDHRGLGAVMMKEWTLPGFLGDVANGHHDVVVPADNPILAAVSLADALATRLRFNLAPALPRPEPTPLIDYFGLADGAEMDAFLEAVKARFQSMTEVLDRGGH
jgi:HD-like signal output (HDOD) protein